MRWRGKGFEFLEVGFVAGQVRTSVTVLGLGSMGRAVAAAFLAGGREVTVWNRTPGRDGELIAAGAHAVADIAEAVEASPVVIVVLLDHASVHAALEGVVRDLSGRRVINLTSTTPEEARELASWAGRYGIELLDGGIMVPPQLIGGPAASVLYSGSRAVFDENRGMFELLGSAEYFGADAGVASAYDFALLSAMYGMFGGFFHGAALARSAGISVGEYGERAASLVATMSKSLAAQGAAIESGDYRTDMQNIDLHKAAVDAILRATIDAGLAPDLLAPLQAVIDKQVDAGHGKLSLSRTVEELG
ncbi:NAD(P)-binding domain-containing protein [Nocardia sp. NPDC051030]|uniref:NAD(P)-dependent oxidoreductase n=1 Tax=Nocardia sp. NPDC051030 TaxID=3155162 RepID=UPI00344783AE